MLVGRVGLALVVAAGVVATAAWYGCNIYTRSLLLPGEAGATADSSDDSGDDSGDAAPDPCALAHPPPRPSTDDPSMGPDKDFVVAIRTIDMGVRLDGGPAPTLGWDLDSVDTCCGSMPESCRARVSGAMHCDQEGGRDDSTALLVYDLSVLSNGQFNQDEINTRLNVGDYGILAHIRQYNGQPNDTQVELSLFSSNGTGNIAPQWKGTDVWTVDPGSGSAGPDGGVIPAFVDINAYVAGGVLVGSLDFPVTLGGTGGTSEVTIHLSEGRVSGALVAKSGGYAVQGGLITGRSSVPDLLNEIQAFNDPINGGYLCKGTTSYEGIKTLICQNADIALHANEDNTGALCDAVSVAVAYAAYPARLGGIVPKMGPPKGCPEASPDDCP